MPALIIESLPDSVHARLAEIAASHQRSVAQEAAHLIETAVTECESPKPELEEPLLTWRKGGVLPEYAALIRSGKLLGGTDSTVIISEMRDDR